MATTNLDRFESALEAAVGCAELHQDAFGCNLCCAEQYGLAPGLMLRPISDAGNRFCLLMCEAAAIDRVERTLQVLTDAPKR